MRYWSIFILIFLCLSGCVDNLYAQNSLKLSDKHLRKVNKQTNATKKLDLYRRYFKKDSIRYLKRTDQYWQAKTDSLTDAIHRRERALAKKTHSVKDGVGSKVYRTVYTPWARKQSMKQIELISQRDIRATHKFKEMMYGYFLQYFLDATQNDSLLFALKEQMPELSLPKPLQAKRRAFQHIDPGKAAEIQNVVKKSIPGGSLNKLQSSRKWIGDYAEEIDSYTKYSQVLTSDTLKSLAAAEGEELAIGYLEKTGEFKQVSELNQYRGEVEELRGNYSQYQEQVIQLQDSAYRRQQAKAKAEELVVNYVTENPLVVQGVQKKMALLMKKYSVIPNSNDLSTAVKRSSLKGKTIKERLVIAGNFQVLSWDPFTIDFSPSIGYRFNRRFIVGIGGNYRQTFSTDTIPKLAPEVFGYKAFTSYDVISNFFAYGEFDRNSSGVKSIGDKSARIWHNAAFMGVGRKMTIHKKIEMTAILMYNFLYKAGDPVYPRPFVVRVGFQTSEIAMLKKR